LRVVQLASKEMEIVMTMFIRKGCKKISMLEEIGLCIRT
jgi:hypothetical protein